MVRLFVVLLLSLLSVNSFAQGNNGNGSNGKTLWQKNGIVINDSVGKSVRQNPRVVSLSDDSFVMVWEDTKNGYIDIYAQRMDSTGRKLWGEGGVAVCTSSKNQTFPQIILSGKNDVIIAWQDYRNEYADIYAQKISMSGITIWQKEGVLVCQAKGNQLAPQLISDGGSGAIVTWYDYRSGKGEDIYAQKINSTGIAQWLNDGIPICTIEGTQWYPKIVPDRLGGAIICWDDKRSDYYDIFAQRVDTDGNTIWQADGIPVCTAPENQEFSQIASCEGNNFIVAWQDYRNGNADIYAQKIDLEGKMLLKTNGEGVCNVGGNQEKPQIIEGENPIIYWIDFRNGSGNSDVYCQKLSSNGAPLWSQYGVAVCESSGNQSNPKGVTDGGDGAVIVWQDHRNPSSAIYARRITKGGKAIWLPDGKTICNDNCAAEFPQISRLPNGNIVFVWQDRRRGGLEIFSQSASLTGSTLWKNNGINIIYNFGAVTQQKPKIINSGKGEYIVVWEDYRNGFSNAYAQKINNAGKLLWDREGVRICDFDSNQFNPVLISDDDGGAMFAWEDTRTGVSAIYCQRIDSFGDSLWDEKGILLCPADGEKLNPQITKDLKGGAIIVWQDSRQKAGLFDVFCQKIDKNGSLSWRVEGVDVSSKHGMQTSLKVDSDGEGGAVMTWIEYKSNINTPDIYAQRVSTAGITMWDFLGLSVCRAPEAQRNPDVRVGEQIIVVWEDSGAGSYDIYAQKMNKDGSVVWKCDGISVCSAQFTQHEPKLILNDDGGATITWEDYRNANWDIFAQRIGPDGEQVWEKDGVKVCDPPGTQYSPQITKSGVASSIIVWEDYRNNKSYNIYGQKLSPSGEMLWNIDGLPICVTEGGARNPQIAEDGNNGVVIVWTDYRNGNFDVYAQRINESRNF